MGAYRPRGRNAATLKEPLVVMDLDQAFEACGAEPVMEAWSHLLPIYLPVYLFTYLFTYLPTFLSIYLPFYLFTEASSRFAYLEAILVHLNRFQ